MFHSTHHCIIGTYLSAAVEMLLKVFETFYMYVNLNTI